MQIFRCQLIDNYAKNFRQKSKFEKYLRKKVNFSLKMSARGKGGKVRTKAKSKAIRSGLQFPVGRIHRCLRSETRMRIAVGAAIYLAAVLEYLAAEVLELCGNTALKCGKRRIKPRHIVLAIGNDDELRELTQKAIISCGGVMNRKVVEASKPAN